jgi:Spy/CpxP family protein refolding chaperone
MVIAALALLTAIAMRPALVQGSSSSGTFTTTHGQRSASQSQLEFNRKFQMLSDSLKLTADQSPKARAVFGDEELKVREIKTRFKGVPDTPENREALKKEMDALRIDTLKHLEPILTPSQIAKMKKMHDDEIKKSKAKGASGQSGHSQP